MSDTRQAIVAWAKYFADNKHEKPFIYSEGPDRMSAIGVYPPKHPIACDCSAFVTLCYWLAGAQDPNFLGYNHEGYTGTLMHGLEIPFDQIQEGDIVIYGPGTGWHTAVIVDPKHHMTVSMGQDGDPSYVTFEQDGRQPQRFYRFHTGSNTEPRYPEAVVVPSAVPHYQSAPQPTNDSAAARAAEVKIEEAHAEALAAQEAAKKAAEAAATALAHEAEVKAGSAQGMDATIIGVVEKAIIAEGEALLHTLEGKP